VTRLLRKAAFTSAWMVRRRAMAPTPKKDEGWTCADCQSWNESWRSQCRNCGA